MVSGLRDEHDVALAVLDPVDRVGVGCQQVAAVQLRVGDLRRIRPGTQELPELLPGRVLAHLVDGKPVPAAVNLERHLATLVDRDLLRREHVQLVGAGIGRAADRTRLKTWEGTNRQGTSRPRRR